MSDLADRRCSACRGGEPALSEAEAAAFMGDVPAWHLEGDGKRIRRSFRFKNFRASLAFVNEVGAVAEEEGHHPDISFGWGYAELTLYTHKIGGLHENDFIVAAKIDRLAGG